MTALSIRTAAASLARDCRRRLHHHRHRTGARPMEASAPPSPGPRPAGPAARWSRSSATARCSGADVPDHPGKPGHRLRPAVERLGRRLRLGPRLGRPPLGLGLGRLGSVGSGRRRPSPTTAARCSPICGSGRLHALRLHADEPELGMAGGGVGQCQLPTGTIINAQFPRALLSARAGGLLRRPISWQSGGMATQLKSRAPAPDPLDGMSLPGWLYFDPEFFEAEKRAFLRAAPQIVCHESEIPEAGRLAHSRISRRKRDRHPRRRRDDRRLRERLPTPRFAAGRRQRRLREGPDLSLPRVELRPGRQPGRRSASQ